MTVQIYLTRKFLDKETTSQLRQRLIAMLQASGKLMEFNYIALKRNVKGRPMLSYGDMNLSHSGDILALVYSDSSIVGCDIELVKERRISVKDLLQKINPKMLEQGLDSLEDMYCDWTIREALIKSEIDGAGVFDFANYQVDHLSRTINANKEGNLYSGLIDEYILSVYTSGDQEPQVNLVNIEKNLISPKLIEWKKYRILDEK